MDVTVVLDIIHVASRSIPAPTTLQKYAPYLHYDRYLAAGCPIATGVIEGACRYLVRDRMELTGGVPG